MALRAGPARRAARGACGDLSRHDVGACRLCREERLPRRADRAFRRHRFRAHSRRRRRCAGCGPGPLRRHAVPLHRAILSRRRGGMRAPARRPLRDGGDRAGGGRAGRNAFAALRRPRGGRDRGEHSGAGARRHPHGDQQQARPYGAHHRQQVGDVGGLRHALRRHVRRLFRVEGRLQDRRVRDGALAQPELDGGPRGAAGTGDARGDHRQAAERRASPRPDRSGHAPPLRGARRRAARASWRKSARRRNSSPAATRRRRRNASGGCSISPNTSGVRRRRASSSRCAPSARIAATRSPTASAGPAEP